MTVYANVGHILLKRGNTIQSTAYTGPAGEVTYDTGLRTLRVHDGSTVGGNVILVNQTTLTAYQTYANANAATQATGINTINANIGSFQTYANVHFTDSSYGNANVASYLPTYAGNITAANISLTGNTGFPSNTSTVQAWARVTIGTTAYWTPLYQ
jgi:hypothetical protein